MQIYLVTALLFALLVAIFAVQNTYGIDITFIAWQIKDIPLVLVILGSAVIGAVVVFLLGAFKQIGTYKKLREYKKTNKELLKENEELQESLDAIQQDLYGEEAQEVEEGVEAESEDAQSNEVVEEAFDEDEVKDKS